VTDARQIKPGPGGLVAALRRRIKRSFISGPGRDRRQKPDRIVSALDLRPGQRIADVGSGSGYFTFRLAEQVAPDGRVYAVDTDTDMLWFVQQHAAPDGAVVPVLLSDGALSLPEPVDLLFFSHSYHHLPERVGYFAAARRHLRDGGRVAIVESLPVGLFARLFGHATDPGRITSEMEQAGYHLVAEHDFPPGDSFLIFTPAVPFPAQAR
jgi:arsenite methyltransferase